MARLKALGLHQQAGGALQEGQGAQAPSGQETSSLPPSSSPPSPSSKRLLSRQAQQAHHARHAGEGTGESSWKGKLRHLYEYQYKKLAYVTIILLFLAILQIGYQIATTGDFISKGVSLKGGITVTIADASLSSQEMEEKLREQFPSYDIAVRGITGTSGMRGLIIEADITNEGDVNALRKSLEDMLSIQSADYNLEQIGSALGESFFRQVILSIIIAFVLMALMVIIWFRNIGPSMIVILAAFCDLIETVAVINLFGIKMSAGGIAALLMLIGYSVDTDILLSTRVLKRKEGTVFDATVDAFKTGILMTLTALVAVIIGYFASSADVLRQIMLILIIGLFFDIFNTWIQNAALLRWYLEHREQKKRQAATTPAMAGGA